MEDQYVIGGKLTASVPAASGVWEGGGSDGGSGGSVNRPIAVEIRPDEETTEAAPAETTEATEAEETTEAAETTEALETEGGDVVMVTIFAGQETEAVETVAAEAPVEADLTGTGAAGSWVIPAAGLAAVLIIGLVIGKAKKRKKK